LTTGRFACIAKGRRVKRLAAVASLAAFATLAPRVPAGADDGAALRLMPRPTHVVRLAGCTAPMAGDVLRAWRNEPGDPAGRELAEERWRALGIAPNEASTERIAVHIGGPGAPSGPQAYRLAVDVGGVRNAADADGAFYAWSTLAQLAEFADGAWRVPCVRIGDTPALRWRILSDDVSRGPLPTMRYFRERIRTIASFKMNGYSPYMEHVFLDPRHPLPAPLDGITPQQLRELDAYARRYHVALIPEQQTFAHMHETLRWERYAPLAELPHGYLVSPANPLGEAYVRDLIADELAAVPHPPFFHVGSDEPSDLGRGVSRALVEARGEGPVYTQHVLDAANFVIERSGARPMLWDDALTRHPELFASLPKQLVFVNWHYGSEPTYRPYIERIANGGFEQMVAPGAQNWNEIYPDLDAALGNIDRFVGEGKSAGVLGLFQTVWHDDGETLYEATWYPLLYAAASAWEAGSVDRARFARDFPSAFFGRDDTSYASDLASLARCRTLLRANPRESGDALFWSDPLDSALAGVPTRLDLGAIRLAAEDALVHLRSARPPPLHANAAAVMALAALRYDALARAFQIAREARGYYDDARANAGKNDGYVYRGLNVTKYLFWEERDTLLGLAPLVRAAWEYESRPGHEASVLERYHLAADRAIERADRIAAATYGYAGRKTLPSFDEALGLPAPSR
jgi:hexosaminidase